MRVGLALPSLELSGRRRRPPPWASVVSTARVAENLGFDSVWLPDGEGGIDPVVGLAGLARHTSHLRLGTLVLSAGRRPPTVLAKALATLDVLSGGRLIAGIGAGHEEPARAGASVEDPDVRLARLSESLQVLKGMWDGGPFSFDGVHARAVTAYCLPRPVQRPRPPLWVGGRRDGLLAVAAAHGDGWNQAWTATPDEHGRRTRVLAAACERIGRDPASVTLSLGLEALVGENRADVVRRFERLQGLWPAGSHGGASLDDWRRGRLVGTVDEVREQLTGWGQLGVSAVVVGLGPAPFGPAAADDIELIAAAASLEPDAEHRTG